MNFYPIDKVVPRSFLGIERLAVIVIFLFLILHGALLADITGEENGKKRTDLCRLALEALAKNDTTGAEDYFLQSIHKYDDAESLYSLSKIYLKKNSFFYRNKAYENLRRAVWKEPDNLEYRYEFAGLMRNFARVSSFDEYRKILAKDSSQVRAWLNLGELKAEEFKEYNRSVVAMGDEFMGSLQEFADKDFVESERYFLNALRFDSLNYDASLQLGLLYEEAGQPEKAISLLKRLIANNKDDKQIHLCLGLVYYKTSKLKEAHRQYEIALGMMSREEKIDFTFNSVKMMLDPAIEEIENYSDADLEEFISLYWKANDPLYLTDYNERLLEHYSRVAYSNLKFSLPGRNKDGWRTDMGETVLRYGEPLNRIRMRPQMGDYGAVSMKTEVWNYNDMTFAFTDMSLSGNFQFVWPAAEKDKLVPQVAGNYVDYAAYVKRVRPVFYDPKFEGPKFEMDYAIAQFKSSQKRNHTDLYVTYALPAHDSLFEKNKSGFEKNKSGFEKNKSDGIKYQCGFFFFDKNFEEQFRRINEVEAFPNSTKQLTGTLEAVVRPDSGFASFEVIRNFDKATSSNRANLNIRKFSSSDLDISNIMLASDVSALSASKNKIRRNQISIEPKPDAVFKAGEPLFVYFEIYNLKKDSEGLTRFEQQIEIRKAPEELTFIDKVIGIIGKIFGAGEERINLVSNYQTLEPDPQIYLQLDLTRYETGDYIIKVVITDLLEKSVTETSVKIKWSK